MRREPRTSGMSEAQNHELVECFPVLSCVSCELGRHRKKGTGKGYDPCNVALSGEALPTSFSPTFSSWKESKLPRRPLGKACA